MRTELEALIAEQAKDDTYRVHSISVDAWPSGADAPRSRLSAHDDRHGTLNCYTNLRCRCPKCRAAAAEAKREWRAKRRVARGPYKDRYFCADCGGGHIRRERVYEGG